VGGRALLLDKSNDRTTVEAQNIEDAVLEPVRPTPQDISLQQMEV